MVELGLEPLPFTIEDFKNHIAACMRDEYGCSSLDVGKKALHVHKDDNERVSVDVVPAFVYRLYCARQNLLVSRGAPAEGIALIAAGQRITNFPRQHYSNGCAKNDRAGRRYKRVVRILKRLRNSEGYGEVDSHNQPISVPADIEDVPIAHTIDGGVARANVLKACPHRRL
jgi:hypothetical protein